MEGKLLGHIGGRIRLYRRNSGISMEELARMVNKSKASISKYELGQIAIDVITLFDIARALGVTPFQLIDYEVRNVDASIRTGHTLGETEEFFVYHFQQGSIHLSKLKLNASEEAGSYNATYLHIIDNIESPKYCGCIFYGKMYMNQTAMSLMLRNYQDPTDNALINFTLPLKKNELYIGMQSGLGMGSLWPIAVKLVMSRTPLPVDDQLKRLLTIDGDMIKVMRKTNEFMCPPHTPLL